MIPLSRFPVIALVTALCLMLGQPFARAADPAFALVPPAVVARLKTEADSSLGKTTIAQASEARGRAPGPIPVLHTEGT